MENQDRKFIGLDTYIESVIKAGDEFSHILAAICAPTMRNSIRVQVLKGGMNGIAILRSSEDYACVVHSAGGDPNQRDIEKHAASVVDRLVKQAQSIGAEPAGFADVIDFNSGSKELVSIIGGALVERANNYGIPIMNGETAILGARVNPEIQANVSGTMVSLIKKGALKEGQDFIVKDGVVYAVFNHDGKAAYMNSDGTGTKMEIYEMIKRYHLGLSDSLAMKLDDAVKLGARVMVVGDVVETRGNIPFDEIRNHSLDLGRKLNITYVLRREDVGDRIMGYNKVAPTLNVSGTAVSLIDEEKLKNPLKPSAGEWLVAIRGKPNPRSNGITAKRERMIALFGNDYHNTEIGRIFLEFLAEPSTIFYPVFSRLVDNGLATSVYHMSGGAYKGKLARPLAENDLFVRIKDLYNPDWREIALGHPINAQVAYEKWPMGNEGFISTLEPEKAIKMIKEFGLDAKVVGRIETAAGEKTGAELTAFNGETVYYSGR